MLYEFTNNEIKTWDKTDFETVNLQERRDLQRLLREKIDVISPDLLVIAEEFSDWGDSNLRIDLLALDKNANLIVIELKRGDGGHMDLQALRYAAMISPMTSDQAIEIYKNYLGEENNAHSNIL
jgi:RecB family endonuclease NucS